MDIARQPRRISRTHLQAGVFAVAALALTLAASWGLASMREAAPVVARASVWIDRVRTGELLREVGGPGTLVPEEIRWVVAREAARVESIQVRPGESVTSETVLIELSNPDLEIQALEASRELGSAEAELADRRGAIEMEALAQESRIAQLATEQREAERQARAAEELAKRSLIAELELARRREVAAELASRVALERRRGAVLGETSGARLRAAQEKIERLRALADYRAQQVAELRVTAGLGGVLQELPLEVGQQVTRGQLLAKVARADALRAELRIPEAQAREVRAGQSATIDTRNSVVPGHVVRVDPVVQQGSVTVEVALDQKLPEGARPEQSVDGRVQLERLGAVQIVGRPAAARPGATMQLFVLDESGRYAERRTVKLGGSSVSEIEVADGLEEGDRVILSDMSEWDAVDRIELE